MMGDIYLQRNFLGMYILDIVANSGSIRRSLIDIWILSDYIFIASMFKKSGRQGEQLSRTVSRWQVRIRISDPRNMSTCGMRHLSTIKVLGEDIWHLSSLRSTPPLDRRM